MVFELGAEPTCFHGFEKPEVTSVVEGYDTF